jgi:hypothetical protein
MPPAVLGFEGHLARDDQPVGILRVDDRHGLVARRDAGILRDVRPRLAGVVRPVDGTAGRRGRWTRAAGRGCSSPASPASSSAAASDDVRVEALGVARGDHEFRLRHGIRQPVRERLPRIAAVGRLEDAAARAAPGAVLPRPLPRFPHRCVHDVRVGRIDVHVLAAGVLVLVEHLLERLAAVGRAENAAFFVRPVRMAQHGHEESIGILRIDFDLRNLLAITEPQVCPRLAGVRRLVDAVAHRQIGPLQALAAPHIDDVGIGRRDGDPPNRSGGLVLEDRRPRAAGVGRFPHAAVHHADVEGVRLTRHAGHSFGAAGTQGPDVPPAHFRVEVGADGACLTRKGRDSDPSDDEGSSDNSECAKGHRERPDG